MRPLAWGVVLGFAISAPLGCGSDGNSGGGGGGTAGSAGSSGSSGSAGQAGCPPCPAGETCLEEFGACAAIPQPDCKPGTRWSNGIQAFKETTAAWKLTGVEGTRLNVADVDGDGFPDLIVRRGGVRSDDFSPGGTRHAWVMRNTGQGSFEDITQASGLLAMRSDPSGSKGRPGEVMAFADVDNDGDVDAFTGLNTTDPSKSLGETSEVMLNDGTGKFTFGPDGSAARSAGQVENPAAAVFVDFDRDGKIDLWVPQNTYISAGIQASPQQDRLYQGDGTGNFVDVTASSGLTTKPWAAMSDLNQGLSHSNAWAGVACDLNGDGNSELLAASYGRAPNHLWLGLGPGQGFANQSVASGYAYDADYGWSDNQFARCYCQQNPNAEDCAGVPAPQIACTQPNWNHGSDREKFRLGGNSGATTCADINNDGHFDLLTSEIKHWWAGSGADGSELLVNSGDPNVVFTRPGDEALGMAIDHSATVSWDEGHMTNAVVDFDNDGWLDIYQGASDYAGNHGLLFHQDSALKFVEVPRQQGVDHNRSHGVVVADFDRDGDLGPNRGSLSRSLRRECPR